MSKRRRKEAEACDLSVARAGLKYRDPCPEWALAPSGSQASSHCSVERNPPECDHLYKPPESRCTESKCFLLP